MSEATGLAGLIASSDSNVERELEFFGRRYPALLDRTARVFSETSGMGVFPPDNSIVGAAYYVDTREIFNLVCVGRNTRVFRSEWGNAFFGYLNGFLREGGRLVIPYCSDEKAPTLGGYRLGDLQELFGQTGNPIGKAWLVEFERSEELPQARSILSWFLRHYGAIVHAEITLRTQPEVADLHLSDPIVQECLLDDERPRRVAGAGGSVDFDGLLKAGSERNPPRQIHYGEQFFGNLKSISYLVSGIKYKGAIVKHIIQEHCEVGGPRSVIDFGGAYGLLVAELLLDEDMRMSKGVVCDLNVTYTVAAGILYRSMRESLRGRFFSKTTVMEDFRFDQTYSVILALSSLLYVPGESRVEFVSRCWEHLDVGGILCFFEVPKANPAYKDFDIQFTAEEIDSLLGSFGEVVRYGATSLAPLSREEAAERPVFRVVRKLA